MVIEYKNFTGVIIEMKRVKGRIYYFKIKDLINNAEISFNCDIYDIKLTNCTGNEFLFKKVGDK